MKLRRTLTTLPLVFVIYFNVSGGPFTMESLVSQVGPGLAVLILALVPLIWSVPETLIVAELASMLPEEGGYYRWVGRAFGPFWAFQNGWLTWIYSLVDMALYPVLFNQYLAYFFPGAGALARWGIAIAVIWGATAVNLRGALPVGRVSISCGLFILGGFVLLTASSLGLSAAPPHPPWRPFTRPGGDAIGGLGVGLSIALWNYIGWDNASTVEGEMVSPSRSYPRALGFALPLVALGYLLPVMAALSTTDWTLWHEGGWPEIALAAGGALGPPLAVWLALAGMASALGLFSALLLSYSRIPLVMAADGLLPRALAKTDARGTPRNSVLVSAVFYSIFALLPFTGLVVADVLLYAMALFLEFAALVALRAREPELRGPFRIPLGLPGVSFLAAVPMLVLCLVAALEIHDRAFGRPAILISLLGASLGPAGYWLADRAREKRMRRQAAA